MLAELDVLASRIGHREQLQVPKGSWLWWHIHMDFGSLKCCNFGKIRTEWVLADSFITTKQLFSSHTQEIQVCASQPRGNSRVPPYTDQFPHQCPWKTLPPPVCPWTPELTVSPYPGSTFESSRRRASSDGTECLSARPVGKEEEFTLWSEWAAALWITVPFSQEPRHSNRQTMRSWEELCSN